MPLGRYIVCYDIADPRRLARLHRGLRRHGVPIEYSMFLLSGDHAALERCLKSVVPLIDATHDDLRAYVLPHRGAILRIGRTVLPAGIHWSGLPATCRAADDDAVADFD